jgi:hypothetical protein
MYNKIIVFLILLFIYIPFSGLSDENIQISNDYSYNKEFILNFIPDSKVYFSRNLNYNPPKCWGFCGCVEAINQFPNACNLPFLYTYGEENMGQDICFNVFLTERRQSHDSYLFRVCFEVFDEGKWKITSSFGNIIVGPDYTCNHQHIGSLGWMKWFSKDYVRIYRINIGIYSESEKGSDFVKYTLTQSKCSHPGLWYGDISPYIKFLYNRKI